MLVVKIESCNGSDNCSGPYCTQHPKKKREYSSADYKIQLVVRGNEIWLFRIIDRVGGLVDQVPFEQLRNKDHPTFITFSDHPEKE